MKLNLFIRMVASLAILGVCEAVNIELVTVGNDGNPARGSGFGAGQGHVDYEYHIGKYEVTFNQYLEFLNSVDPTGANTLGLWHANNWHMGQNDTSDFGYEIARDLNRPEGQKYYLHRGRGDRALKNVDLHDAARFVNWLHNGQGNGDTETGSYTMASFPQGALSRNPGWKYAIPTVDEWFKAAYHGNDGVTGNYYDYATASNEAPSGTTINADNGNHNFVANVEVAGAGSAYGVFHMAGNVREWAENSTARGAVYYFSGGSIDGRADRFYNYGWNSESYEIGFRVIASIVPVPTPDITVEQPTGTALVDGATADFGEVVQNTSHTLAFTIHNDGDADLTGISPAFSGPAAAEYALTTAPAGSLAPGAITSFMLTFTPVQGGNSEATLHLASNDPNESPFTVELRAAVVSLNDDADGDGMGDHAEFLLADLGFDWQLTQPQLVETYYRHAPRAGLIAESQIESLRAESFAIRREAATGKFVLKLDWKHSADLRSFSDLPVSVGQVSVNAEGDLELRIEGDSQTRFFLVEIK